VPEVRSDGSWPERKLGKVWGRKRPPTKQSRTARRSELGVVKRSIPRPSTRRKSRDCEKKKTGIHEARVLVVENVLGGRSRFGRISRRAITVSRKASRGARPSLKETTIR